MPSCSRSRAPGAVQLPNGEVIRLQYADQNGQPLRSIGRHLVEKGELTTEQATMPGIRAWLVAHPERLQEVLNANPSVVFFNETPLGDPNVGPKGAQGIPSTPGRSIAVDPASRLRSARRCFCRRHSPHQMHRCSDSSLRRTPEARLTARRARISSGAPGLRQVSLAGKMRQTGSMWLLWPRGVALPAGADGLARKGCSMTQDIIHLPRPFLRCARAITRSATPR